MIYNTLFFIIVLLSIKIFHNLITKYMFINNSLLLKNDNYILQINISRPPLSRLHVLK